MQVSSTTAAAAAPSTSSSLVDQIKKQASLLADDSGASNDQKVDAYLAISKAIAQSASTGAGWFQQSTQADRDAVNAIMDGSFMAKQIRQAADDFNARGGRASRSSNVMADQLDYLNGLSETQQKMIFAGTASLDQTGSLDSWKGFLQQNADGRDQQMAGEGAVKVTLSDKAKAAIAQAEGDDGETTDRDPAVSALAALGASNAGDGVVGAALKMLEKAAADRAEAREKARAEKADKTQVHYEAGDHVDTSV